MTKRSASILIEGHIIEGQVLDQAGHEVRVTVIAGGTSKNGYNYDEAALRSIARVLEGAHAYADHARTPADAATRSVRDVVGFYKDAQFVPSNENTGARVDATLHIFEAAGWLWSLINEACTLGRPELVGLSIDIYGEWKVNESTKARDITNIVSLNSCDVVTRPSAGGAFRRILHDESPEDNPPQGDPPTMDPKTQETENQEPQQQAQVQESQVQNPVPAVPTPTPTPTPEAQTHILESQIREQRAAMEQQRQQLEQLIAQTKLDRAAVVLERRLQESILPNAVKDQVRSRFTGRVFEESELEQDLSSALTMMAQLARSGVIRDNNYEKPSVGSMISEAEKVQAAFDRMFDLEIDSKLGNIRGFTSILEAYTRVTGDSRVSGISGRSQIGDIRVSESAPMERITEADTTTASFSYLLGTSMNKRLLKDYQAWPAEWMKFCTIAPIRDFKQQSRVRFGAFGSLPIVAEDTAYTAVTLTDSAATYVPQKRGNLVTVSREVIINDDLMAVKQIPTKLAVAAAYTLAEFVYAFLSANPNIYDGNALFTSGAPHSNLGAAALTTAAMQTGITAMREQTNYAGKRIGLRPRFLIVPPELEWQSMVVTKSAGVPGSNNNDINPMLGYVVPIVSPQLTSTTQWFLAADPREIDTIEVGFVGGQVNPALFIQDQPLFGLNFTQDVITYKVRHEYGGTPVDYRGLYRGI